MDYTLFEYEEVYDDETGQWIAACDADTSFFELEEKLAWERDQELQALLEQRRRPFTGTEAFSLCASVIVNDIGAGVLDALLDVCPPLGEFLDLSRVDYPVPEFWDPLGLTELAAYLGREALLDVLLRRDGNVNARPAPGGIPVSPLEAAVWGGSLACVERLLREPDLDPAFSIHLQRLWAMPKPNAEQRRCLRRVAPRVRGLDFPENGPVPIPETFHPMAAVEMGNDALFLRCCRERGGLSRADAEHSLKMLWTQAALVGRQDAPDMLLALLETYPEALEQKEGRALLALSAAAFPEDGRLEPWLEWLRGRRLPLSLLAEHFPGWERHGAKAQSLRKRIALA